MSDKAIIVIEARTPDLLSQIRKAWSSRGMYGFLFREVASHRYKQTMLGFWWLILRPLIPALVTVVVFTAVVPMPTHGEPYPIFFLASYVCWNVFQATVVLMPRAITWMRSVMRRTYFPRILLPLACIGPPLAEGLVVLAVLAIAIVGFGIHSGVWYFNASWALLLFPVCVAFALMLGVAVGMVLSVIAVFVRDVVYVTPYIVQLFLVITPVMYPVKFVPEQFRWILYVLNPLASVVETARWSVTGIGVPPLAFLAVSLPLIAVVFILAAWFFVRAEPYLSDQL